MIVLIGSSGSMGRRYQAILRFLDQDFIGFDLGQDAEAIAEAERGSTGVIIASPTDTHERYLRAFDDLPVPILCEKPVMKNLPSLARFLDDRRAAFRMMTQYALLDQKGLPDYGLTHYDFYHHGTDGLAWNCMQLIGLARGAVQLYEQSPIWTCYLNGRKLSLDQVGWAYVEYVRLWLREPNQDREEIYRMHSKAAAWK